MSSALISSGVSATNNKKMKKKMATPLPGSGTGLDAVLTEEGKHLQTGQEIRFLLVKGPSLPPTLDPVNPKAPKQSFPLIAKFSESVVKPNFSSQPWKTARLFQQDIPKAEDDSDEETANNAQPKKRWRSRSQKEVGRQWVLQEQVEFLETMMAKRQKASAKQSDTDGDTIEQFLSGTSTRYEGHPEHNTSQYILLETNHLSAVGNTSSSLQVTILPSNATVAFSQPKATNTLSMSEAEMAIQDQRGKVTRFMMHDQQRVFQGKAPIHRSRTRLLGKLMPEDTIDPKTGKTKTKRQRLLDGDFDEDDDDVMSDLAFRNRKGNAKARNELLSSFGDDGMKVDSDGVLGGSNDGMFGQRGQKFGSYHADQAVAAEGGNPRDGGDVEDAGTAPGGTTEKTSNDGLAMSDDFYKRDVQAEYEELDYDANEQFDDDDVDVGETEMMIEDTVANDDDDGEDLEDDVATERLTGAEGLASLAGFKLMLAKARGEITPEHAAELAVKNKRQAEEADKRLAEDEKDGDSPGDYVANFAKEAELARIKAESKATVSKDVIEEKSKKPAYASQEVDENGQRLITLEAVRREIWLNDGRIDMKRLTKIFDVNKKSKPERQLKFKEAVHELCTMESDPVGGRMLVLKQHYRRGD